MVIDYLSESNQFVYLDPARANGEHFYTFSFIYCYCLRFVEARLVAADLLDSARRHPGTDEDIVFCYKEKTSPPIVSSV